MPEPLKFRKVWVTLENPDEQDIVTWFEAVVSFRKDVKSAVQGLLNELEHSVEYEADGRYIRYELVVELIKKWLADVVSEDV